MISIGFSIGWAVIGYVGYVVTTIRFNRAVRALYPGRRIQALLWRHMAWALAFCWLGPVVFFTGWLELRLVRKAVRIINDTDKPA